MSSTQATGAYVNGMSKLDFDVYLLFHPAPLCHSGCELCGDYEVSTGQPHDGRPVYVKMSPIAAEGLRDAMEKFVAYYIVYR